MLINFNFIVYPFHLQFKMSLVKCGVTRDRTVKGLKGNFSKKRQCSSSFKALRQALNSLHRLDDFDSEEIGAGFFSKIYRVSNHALFVWFMLVY